MENQQEMCEDWVPSTNLLWGDSDSSVTHETIANLEQESVTLNDIEASMSMRPKPRPHIPSLHGVSILVEI